MDFSHLAPCQPNLEQRSPLFRGANLNLLPLDSNLKHRRPHLNSGSQYFDDATEVDPASAAALIHRATQGKLDRKLLQLCRQIQRELSLILSGELDDDRIRDLTVLFVQPFPYASHLLVTLTTSTSSTQTELLQLDAALANYRPFIRTEIARAITRRKAPDLSFRVINAE